MHGQRPGAVAFLAHKEALPSKEGVVSPIHTLTSSIRRWWVTLAAVAAPGLPTAAGRPRTNNCSPRCGMIPDTPICSAKPWTVWSVRTLHADGTPRAVQLARAADRSAADTSRHARRLAKQAEQAEQDTGREVTETAIARALDQERLRGTVVLHHRALSPVVFRAWMPPMEVFADALAHTTEVTYCQTEPGRFNDFGSLSRLEFVRPEPVDSEFLAGAVEPLCW
ncbi:hypothetical protein [Crossiella sp. NPDC003009]